MTYTLMNIMSMLKLCHYQINTIMVIGFCIGIIELLRNVVFIALILNLGGWIFSCVDFVGSITMTTCCIFMCHLVIQVENIFCS